MSSSAQQFTGHQTQIHERRAHPRILPKTLIYVACGESNGGMVLNVSDGGLAISMAIPVGDEAYSNVHVRMNGLPQSVEVHGRIAWTTKSKKRAGIELVDVSEEQRRQIREWLAREGVRDVNLLPRSEYGARILPSLADVPVSSNLAEPHADETLVADPSAANPALSADLRGSLLAGLGGTPPEFLGPAQNQESLAADSDDSTSSQGSKPDLVGFREHEWDLASITMIPRKRSKPEGLSALALLLLWIAIPSFGIGIIVGRRPLQHWLLSRGNTVTKNIARRDIPEPRTVHGREESPGITAGYIDAAGPQSIPGHSVTPPTNSLDVNAAATKSFVSAPAFVDTKLLNSMSTQELRAMKSPPATEFTEKASPSEASESNAKSSESNAKPSESNAKPSIVTKDRSPASATVDETVSRTDSLPVTTHVSTNPRKSVTANGDGKDKSVASPIRNTQSIPRNEDPGREGFSKQPSTDQVAKSKSVASGVNATEGNHRIPPSNAAVLSSAVSSASSTPVPLKNSGSPAAGTNMTATENYSIARQNISSANPVNQSVANVSSVPPQSADHAIGTISGSGNSTSASSSVKDSARTSSELPAASGSQPAGASTTATTAGPVSSRPAPIIASDTAQRDPSNAKSNTASTTTASTAIRTASSVYPSPSARSATPAPFSHVAPVNAQPPLHGVMLVARKNNEAFRLRLPVESVAGGRSISVQMQRFVVVPAARRWHRHGPIAKVAIGELLTEVAPNQLATSVNARPGDAVTVRAFVDRNGAVEDLRPVSGRFALLPRVMRDLREWQFDQTLVDGKPVESEINITVEFGSNPGALANRSREIQAQNSLKP